MEEKIVEKTEEKVVKKEIEKVEGIVEKVDTAQRQIRLKQLIKDSIAELYDNICEQTAIISMDLDPGTDTPNDLNEIQSELTKSLIAYLEKLNIV